MLAEKGDEIAALKNSFLLSALLYVWMQVSGIRKKR